MMIRAAWCGTLDVTIRRVLANFGTRVMIAARRAGFGRRNLSVLVSVYTTMTDGERYSSLRGLGGVGHAKRNAARRMSDVERPESIADGMCTCEHVCSADFDFPAL